MQEKSQHEEKAVPKDKEQRFVAMVIERCKKDKGLAARLRRADNPATEYQSWEFIASWVDLEKDYERVPYVVVAAAIAKAKAETNGILSLGKALLASFDNDRESDPAKMRLRRLLACSDIVEVSRILRPILMLIDSKLGQSLDYARLLKQLRYFDERTKIQWAQEFYGQPFLRSVEEVGV